MEKYDIVGCSSCGKDHNGIELERLEKPEIIDGHPYEFAGKCPETGETVYAMFQYEKPEKEPTEDWMNHEIYKAAKKAYLTYVESVAKSVQEDFGAPPAPKRIEHSGAWFDSVMGSIQKRPDAPVNTMAVDADKWFPQMTMGEAIAAKREGQKNENA